MRSELVKRLSVVVASAMLAACWGADGPAATTAHSGTGTVAVALDDSGALLAPVLVEAGDGSQFALSAGTVILTGSPAAGFDIPAAGSAVTLTLRSLDAHDDGLPSGLLPGGRFAIELTVAGAPAEAVFVPPPAAGSTGPFAVSDLGAKLVVQIAQALVDDGTMGFLFRVRPSVLLEPVGASAVHGDPYTRFNPPGTGAYASGHTGKSPPPPASVPSGPYWSRITIPDPGCVTVGGTNTQVCGPSQVSQIEIFEPSTAGVIGSCWFNGSDFATAGGTPGYSFWCQRVQDPNTFSTEITISSDVANLPGFHVEQVRISDGKPMAHGYGGPQGPLHKPDGSVTSDPYTERDLKFAGGKELLFKTVADRGYQYWNEKGVSPLSSASYSTSSDLFHKTSPKGFTASIWVVDTLDSRLKIAEDVVLKNDWTVVAGEAKGNRGSFEFVSDLYAVALSIDWIEESIGSNEGNGISGDVYVLRGNSLVSTAEVSINGMQLAPTGSSYSTDNLQIPGLGAGQTLHFKVTDQQDTLEWDTVCPAQVDFTQPSAGATFKSDDPVDVTWSGTLNYNSIGGGRLVGFRRRAKGNVVGFFPLEPYIAQLTRSDTHAKLSAFLTEDNTDGGTVFLELRVPGDGGHTPDGKGNATCSLLRRRDVTVVAK